MSLFSNLKKLTPFLDEILTIFYQEILSHKHMAVFFKDDNHIQRLVAMQRQNFLDSLEDSEEEFRARYYKLGRRHYALRVPNIDFLKSTSMLREAFIDVSLDKLADVTYLKHIQKYFRDADSHMSQGYLDTQLQIDKSDILGIISRYKKMNSPDIDIGIAHLEWLHELLLAVEAGDINEAPELDIKACTVHQILSDSLTEEDSPISIDHFNDLHERIHIDANNLFYFIEKKDYPEVLSLYSSLFSVYKITLIFMGNHSLQVALTKAQNELEHSRESLKVLTGLLPICSYCQKIRDEAGSWTRLESYIQEHSEAQFSHGVCENCTEFVEEEIEGWETDLAKTRGGK